ncbi:hypothetical protein RAZWK3B_11106 [Roseobacter sp. AzwK-3b]|nr:hypothetical protein RAZWK3B_11106 [Roseobacter sp. AzwK-3b]
MGVGTGMGVIMGVVAVASVVVVFGLVVVVASVVVVFGLVVVMACVIVVFVIVVVVARVVVMLVVVVVVARVVVMLVVVVACVVVAMVMGGEAGIYAARQHEGFRRGEQRQMRRIPGEGLDRIGHPGRQPRPHPDHQIGLLERPCLGGAHRIGMRRGIGADQQLGRPCPVHHTGDKRLDRGDIGHDARRVGMGRPGDRKTQGGKNGGR